MMRNFFKRLMGKDKKSYRFTTRSLANQTGNGERIRRNGGSNEGGTFWSLNDAILTSGSVLPYGGDGTPVKVEDARKAVQPKEVFDEIKKETPEISFDNLDAKIKVVRKRIDVLKEHLDEGHLGDENRTLFYLENRKKYLKTKKNNPLDWAITTQDAVDDLCKNYKLKVVPLKQYYTLVPKEGIAEMARYTKAYKAITGDMPIYELVIKDEHKETKKKDRDPILLANSPLSNSLFVLGAWDDEVEIVDEIIYGMK